MSDQFAAIFRRHPNDGWFRAGRYDVTTTDIICALSVLSMFLWGLFRDAWNRLPFAPALVRDFELWRLVTWPVASEPTIWLLLGIIFFWLFGQQLEGLFGRGRFLAWVLALTVVPALVLTALGPLDPSIDFMVQYGLSTLFLGGIWVYAATYPGVRWFGVVPLWAVAAVFSVLNLLQFAGNDATGQTIFLLVSIAVALVAGRSLGLATGWPIPHLPLDGAARSPKPKRQKQAKPAKPARGSSGSRVVEGPWKNAPAPMPPPAGPSAADQIELDSLLDKIGANGMDSLTSAEKQRLNDLSKRLRNR
jgi:membrane associated rhomboid family serine protease